MIYLDNSSTAYPRAENLGNIIKDCIDNYSFNVGRTNSVESYSLEEKIYDIRSEVANFFHYNDESSVIFTTNVTMSLNMAINGVLAENDHVIISPYEHNAVLRPLTNLVKTKNISYDIMPYTEDGNIIYEKIQTLINNDTKAIICNHVSNVFGNINDIEKIGKICRQNNLILIVDTAQSAGIIDIDINKNFIDILCFTGHKGLLGPQGIGGIIISHKVKELINPYIFGGTGSFSDLYDMPTVFPDRLEAGTLNIPGIIGLDHSIQYIQKLGIENIYKHEVKLKNYFIEKLKNNHNIKVYDNGSGIGIVSVSLKNMDNAVLTDILSNEYGIITRCGLHCAPLAHKTIGTFPQGTIRFSFGYFNTLDEVGYVTEVINKLL